MSDKKLGIPNLDLIISKKLPKGVMYVLPSPHTHKTNVMYNLVKKVSKA